MTEEKTYYVNKKIPNAEIPKFIVVHTPVPKKDTFFEYAWSRDCELYKRREIKLENDFKKVVYEKTVPWMMGD